MKNLITMASVALLLAACGGAPGDDSPGTTNTTSTGTTDSGSQGQAPDTTILENTADLEVSPDFNFETSRSIAIDFDLAQARTSARSAIAADGSEVATSGGLMSLCTKYTEEAGVYDVDYDSCTVQAPLVDGVYSGSMDVTNDVNSVVGVVWFKDRNLAPVYKEFSLEVGAKVARRGSGPQTIVWR